jgi:tol-pal system protein YbgF
VGSPGLLALPAPETVAGGERDLYRDAFELLKTRDYAAARGAFSEMVERYPQGQFADNGRYWLGEIGYVTQDYAAAKTEFGQLVTNYPLSPKVPSAMLKLGYVAYEQDELSEARRLLEEVVQRFPESTESRLAQGRLDRMQREQQP